MAAGLELPLEERESVDAGIRHIEFLDTEVAAVERLIAQQALGWPEIRRLMSVPGVNLICAATFIAAVGDPRRFLTSHIAVALGPPQAVATLCGWFREERGKRVAHTGTRKG